MSEMKEIGTGYTPRPFQKILHKSLKRFNVLVCHRRFGKTIFSLNEMIDRALRNDLDNPRYAYISPLYSQSKRVAWDQLKKYTMNIPGMVPNEADLRVDIPRPWKKDTIRFTLLGADNPMSLKGIYLDGCIMDEYAEMNPVMWREVIRPTLSDRKGWANFIGTPKGRNSFYDLYNRASLGDDPEWFSALYKASQTNIIPQSELDSARREMTEEEYEQEFECSFTAGIVGAYYAKEMDRAEKDGRITDLPYDPALSVDTFWDLGINDSTVIWFAQRYLNQWRFIDYLEESGHGIPHFAKELQKREYYYGTHYLPHDAQARDLSTGKARVDTFRELGLRNIRVVPKLDLMDGIQASRLILSRCFFDKRKTAKGIECLRNYQRKWDPKGNVFTGTPLHNQWSHGADAFRTFAVGCDEREERNYRNMPEQADCSWNVFKSA